MLGGDARGRSVRSAKDDRDLHLAARHVWRLRRRIDELVHCLHGEIERHELDDRLEASERGADAEPRKTVLGDRRVDDAPRAEFLQQALGHLVGALIFGDLLADDEHVRIAAHFLGHGVAQRLAHGHRDHLSAFRHFGLPLPTLPRKRGRQGGAGVLRRSFGGAGAGASAFLAGSLA